MTGPVPAGSSPHLVKSPRAGIWYIVSRVACSIIGDARIRNCSDKLKFQLVQRTGFKMLQASIVRRSRSRVLVLWKILFDQATTREETRNLMVMLFPNRCQSHGNQIREKHSNNKHQKAAL
jgi:hypothetical protein